MTHETTLQNAQNIAQWCLSEIANGNQYLPTLIMRHALCIVELLGKRTDDQQAAFIDSLKGD